MRATKDKKNNVVSVGDTIKVHGIDERITQGLSEDELDGVMRFVGGEFEVQSINSDGSMVVSDFTQVGDVISGADIAIFPDGAELI